MEVVLVAFAILFVLLFLELPIAFAMTLVGVGGFAYIVGLDPALSMIGTLGSSSVLSYDLSVLPLFVLMGNFVAQSRISQDLYDASNAFIGHRRGGLAIATIIACGGFSAVCGSSLATAATMTKVALPPMRRYKYADSLATGTIAAGGTLGMLIPPSVLLVVYGIMTQTEIGALFIAGIVPGLLGVLCYSLAVVAVTQFRPELGPPGDRVPWRQRFALLRGVWGMLVLFLLVIGGIYFGLFTPSEAAGIGAAGAFFIALGRRTLTWRSLWHTLVETARTSTAMFAVLIGAVMFSNFINVARLPNIVGEWIAASGFEPLHVVLVILVIYLLLGCVFESFSMILLTVPIFYPIIAQLGFDLIWFGIIVVVVTEISLITPPIGLNVFVLQATARDVPLGTIFRGVMPFIAADTVRLAILVLFPAITLFLPSLM